MLPISPHYEKLRPMLESRVVDWTQVTMKDVQYALDVVIGARKTMRYKEKHHGLSLEDHAFMTESGAQLRLLFEGQAIKWAQAGMKALRQKIQRVEARLSNPSKTNPYDGILCEKLHQQLQKLEQSHNL
jgi:hypothetical protein